MNKKILLIEDKPGLSETLKSLLELHQYDVIIAVNGDEGARLARRHHPDLIISDIYMPVLNGYDMLELFKKDDQLKHIPVIMLSAKTEIDEINLAMKKGAAGYVTKPFLFKNLHAAIRKALRSVPSQ
jgi:DNA-binding response OmpR family regulator